MIISPPYLPTRPTGSAREIDETWLNQAMPRAPQGKGRFPLSHNLCWHGGLHLRAPMVDSTHDLPVRAIADGTVVFFRKPIQQTSDQDPNAALAYGTEVEDDGKTHDGICWTDNGCVVLKHETEIGADGDTPVKVTFFSVYMHLRQLDAAIKSNAKIYRKDKIGYGGYIYGDSCEMHLEIVCDDDNLEKLIGRKSGKLDITKDGRKSVIFGDIYFYIPAGTPFYNSEHKPSQTDEETDTTTDQDFIIVLSYDAGYRRITTYKKADKADNSWNDLALTSPVAPGEWFTWKTIEERNAEYNLYKDSGAVESHLHVAVFELFSFGRTLGDNTLNPTDIPHWRKIQISDDNTAVWINLHPTDGSIKVFSDADFPDFMGWTLIDGSNSVDSRCKDTILHSWLGQLYDPTDTDGSKTSFANKHDRLDADIVQRRLSRAICKFPTEWNPDTIDTLWGWLKTKSEERGDALSDDDYTKFQNHVKALTFWKTDIGIPEKPWHFHPQEFIKVFRRCGWLSKDELAQCIPREPIEQTSSHGSTIYPRSSINWNTALSRSNHVYYHLNITLRRYLVSSNKLRIAYFLGNSIQETMYFSRTSELNGSSASYAPWYGRGFMQLTWEGNYNQYGKFRGRGSNAALSFRDAVEHDLSEATESAGFYWSSCARSWNDSHALMINSYADIYPTISATPLNNVCTEYSYPQHRCTGSIITMQHYYPSEQFEHVARAVNTGSPESHGTVNGVIPRTIVFQNCLSVLTEIDGIIIDNKQRP